MRRNQNPLLTLKIKQHFFLNIISAALLASESLATWSCDLSCDLGSNIKMQKSEWSNK